MQQLSGLSLVVPQIGTAFVCRLFLVQQCTALYLLRIGVEHLANCVMQRGEPDCEHYCRIQGVL